MRKEHTGNRGNFQKQFKLRERIFATKWKNFEIRFVIKFDEFFYEEASLTNLEGGKFPGCSWTSCILPALKHKTFVIFFQQMSFNLQKAASKYSSHDISRQL